MTRIKSDDIMYSDALYHVQFGPSTKRHQNTMGLPVHAWRGGVREAKPLAKLAWVAYHLVNGSSIPGSVFIDYAVAHRKERERYYDLYSHIQHELEIGGEKIDLNAKWLREPQKKKPDAPKAAPIPTAVPTSSQVFVEVSPQPASPEAEAQINECKRNIRRILRIKKDSEELGDTIVPGGIANGNATGTC